MSKVEANRYMIGTELFKVSSEEINVWFNDLF